MSTSKQGPGGRAERSERWRQVPAAIRLGLPLVLAGVLSFAIVEATAGEGAALPEGIAGRFERHQAGIEPEELALFDRIESEALSVEALDALSTSEFHQRLDAALEVLASLKTATARERVRGLARSHPDAFVRRMLLYVIERDLPGPEAKTAVIDLIHDSDDLVAFAAITMAGRHRIQEAIEDLVKIVGIPSGTLHSSGKPVGVGAALGTEALLQTLGTHTFQEVARRERSWRSTGSILAPAVEAPVPPPPPPPGPRPRPLPLRQPRVPGLQLGAAADRLVPAGRVRGGVLAAGGGASAGELRDGGRRRRAADGPSPRRPLRLRPPRAAASRPEVHLVGLHPAHRRLPRRVPDRRLSGHQ